mgnify:CR=1 FL=1
MEEKIRELVGAVFAPEQIESVKVFNGRAIVTLQNAVENPEVTGRLKSAISEMDGIAKVSIVYTAPKANIGLKPENPKWEIKGVRKIIGVASGKGGVGKSTTAVNLALALSRLGLKTALFDADIYGPSIPTMLGYEGVGAVSYDGKTFEPFRYQDIASMSIGTLIDKDVPLIWRGAKACGAIEQLLTEVNWGEIDVMVIDMPPGTGDIQITLSQKIDMDGAVIVSTPQDIALIDAVKGVNMFKRVDVPILGIVENMSYFECPDCKKKYNIFGESKIDEVAKELGVPVLARLPIDPKTASLVDKGAVELCDDKAIAPIIDKLPK